MLDTRKDFAGMYIQHLPKYRINVLFKNQKGSGNFGNTGKIQRRLAKTSWRSFVKIRKVSKSLDELKEEQRLVSNIVNHLNIPASLGINISKNQTKLVVIDKNELEIALSTAGLVLPSDILIIEVDALAGTEANDTLQAGLRLVEPTLGQDCTAGFAVKNGAGEIGVLTSGHCKNDLKFGGLDMEFMGEQYNGPYDVQWHKLHRLSTDTIVNEVRTCTIFGLECGSETIIGALINLPEASYVCKYGATTGKTCGFISDVAFLPPSKKDEGYFPTATFVFVEALHGENLSSGGDSGGPWFSNQFAVGVHTGGDNNENLDGNFTEAGAYYMPIQDISILGVSILTQ